MTETEITQIVIELVASSALIGVTVAVLESFFGSGR